jgi:predicted nucleic acid-binding protein
LAFIGRLELLRSQFKEVWIPETVRAELDRMPNLNAKSSIERALQEGWLRSRAVDNPRLAAALGNDLDKGEAEAIALATEIHADALSIDEKEGRSFARQAGLPVRGVLGILVRAKRRGEIASVRTEIEALRSRAGFFVAFDLEAEVLRSAGE